MDKPAAMISWERNLGVSYKQQWYQALQQARKASRCISHWETVLKILHRLYLTPQVLANCHPGSTPHYAGGSAGVWAPLATYCGTARRLRLSGKKYPILPLPSPR